jgi:hypothetical protein
MQLHQVTGWHNVKKHLSPYSFAPSIFIDFAVFTKDCEYSVVTHKTFFLNLL